ncbi:triacylglycerol lipase [Massilia sp. IC2-476]|uniref:esterase/lipase family protein n=1 Tax=Massilia sp. IC2-476 TaxID=2887199 RepID=UPI001D0F4F84|nr:GPI inositol-deacylase [Massilia sp. IC2-476]MCC2970953.1 GPI inositol-deacylase [Massilia sp. IC2-476]
MSEKVKYEPEAKNRFAELRPSVNGRLETEWRLTDATLITPVKITVPPKNAVPIVFVPGIMGSNLCDLDGKPVWLLDAIGPIPAKLVAKWAGKSAGYRQELLHPKRTKVYTLGAVPTAHAEGGMDQKNYLMRGWGEVSEASYHKFLLWLDAKLNGERDPANWTDFKNNSLSEQSAVPNFLKRKLSPGLIMDMPGLPQVAERGFPVEPIKSDDLLKRAKSAFPIYAFGYNWLASNTVAAEALKERIDKVISENNGAETKCTQVILITHSMGGLVARACSQLTGMSTKILGIVHGVMPSTGAAVAYRRCKVGMKDEDAAAGLVIGADGREVTAVFAQAPGALQLLPSFDYGSKWMEVADQDNKKLMSLPLADPYEEIYLEKDKWWGLVKEEWLSPANGKPIRWADFVKNVKIAREFHRTIEGQYHHNTYVFYGGGPKKGSFAKIRWNVKKGVAPKGINAIPNERDNIVNLRHSEVRTDGSNNIYIGGGAVPKVSPRGETVSGLTSETSFWELRCAGQDSSGDGTVPANSGCAPRRVGGRSVLQQFEVPDIAHEPAYRNSITSQLITLYAVTKLAAKAEIS